MKKIFFLVLVAITSLAYSQEVKLSGKITNYSGTDSLKLLVYSSNSPSEISIPLTKKGEFSYSFKNTMTNFSKLYFNAEDFVLLIISPNEKITVNANFENMSVNPVISGSIQSQLWHANHAKLTEISKAEETKKADYEKSLASLELEKVNHIITFIKQNPSSLASLAIIEMLDISEYASLYSLLDSALMKNHKGNPIVENFHTQVQSLLFLKEGALAPDIQLTDINGKLVSLSSLRGKIVLIDFWATWCRPCRMEIPNVQKAYTMYQAKGFEVFAVSIDQDKLAWETLVKQEKYPWISTHDSNRYYGSLYNVSSIPFTVLLDKEGKVIAKNVRGQALEEHLQVLLGN